MTVAVLFARADSNYKALTDCEVYDADRDARTYDGPWPVVAHPPCRAWGRLRTFAKPRNGERLCATWSVRQVRRFGGVLEHPAGSTLWPRAGLPAPGACRDKYGGWTLGIHQHWWGHRAAKATLLYIVGCEPADIPDMPPLRLDEPTHVVQGRGSRPHISKAEREHTPPELARWLVDLAGRCKTPNVEINRRATVLYKSAGAAESG